MLYLISMKIFEGNLGLNCVGENIDDVIGYLVRQTFFFKHKNLQKSSSPKWLNRSRQNFTGMIAHTQSTIAGFTCSGSVANCIGKSSHFVPPRIPFGKHVIMSLDLGSIASNASAHVKLFLERQINCVKQGFKYLA